MRISLLLEREPFREIVSQTLAPWWTRQHGTGFQLEWSAARRGASTQRWSCNSYLNALFAADVDTRVFDPIRKEFSRSRVAWRRPLQRAAVALATRRPLMYAACQHRLNVTPHVPDSRWLLIIPGNHKLRVLDLRRRTVDVLLKAGFDPAYVTREIESRALAARCGVRTPEILQVTADRPTGRTLGFREPYVSGTPLNRLPHQDDVRRFLQMALDNLQPLMEATSQDLPRQAYVQGLVDQIVESAEASSAAEPTTRRAVCESAQALGQRALDADDRPSIKTSMAHGDFQPANILVVDQQPWLIDWEYADRRQVAYDPLVFYLQSRFPRGLAGRIEQFVQRGCQGPEGALIQQHWGSELATRGDRQLSACVFLLEELLLHCRENGNPRFHTVGQGFYQILHETQAWLTWNQPSCRQSCLS
jgi:hypothetical protein